MNNSGISEINELIEAIGVAESTLRRIDSRSLGLPPDLKLLRAIEKRLRDQARHSTQRYTVLLLGEFKAGKSSFVNALLGLSGDQCLLVGDEPLTAKPTRCTFRHPGDPVAKWVHFDGREEVKESWSDAIPATVDNDLERTVAEVILFLEHPLLHAIDVLDMPGTGAAYHQKHADTTREYIANSEVVLWIVGQAPSAEGRKDLRIATDQNVPIITVFNAWGYLDEERNRRLRDSGFSQNDIEADVRENFPSAFKHHPNGFRVYAGKCAESLSRGISSADMPPDFGIQLFKTWLHEYYSTFSDISAERQRNVLEQVERIKTQSALDIGEWLKEWEAAIEREGEGGKALNREMNAINRMEHILWSKLRVLAKERADSILRRIQNASESFIESKLRVENYDILVNLVTGGMDSAQNALTEELRRDYLRFDESPSWLDQEAADFIAEAWVITEAEWRRFLEEIPLESPVQAGASTPPQLPFDEIGNAVKQGVASVIQRIVTVGAVIAFLAAIPGGAIVDAIGISIALLGALFHDPLAKPRSNAIRRIGSEIDLQRSGLKKQLQDEAMKGGHASLKCEFQDNLEKRRGGLNKRLKAETEGRDALTALQMNFSNEDDVA